ncbi:hypothetical protein [Neobacillus cucumis]|nr:hypothetical protein [Neobacillus cucumis]MDR4945967.1 hypothetical protein [Neobacillus cucumis]
MTFEDKKNQKNRPPGSNGINHACSVRAINKSGQLMIQSNKI